MFTSSVVFAVFIRLSCESALEPTADDTMSGALTRLIPGIGVTGFGTGIGDGVGAGVGDGGGGVGEETVKDVAAWDVLFSSSCPSVVL